MHSECFCHLSTWIGVHAYRITQNSRQASALNRRDTKNVTPRKSLATANRFSNAPGGGPFGRVSRSDHCLPQEEQGVPAPFLGTLRRHAVPRPTVRIGR